MMGKRREVSNNVLIAESEISLFSLFPINAESKYEVVQ
jgi:hypothetical protein